MHFWLVWILEDRWHFRTFLQSEFRSTSAPGQHKRGAGLHVKQQSCASHIKTHRPEDSIENKSSKSRTPSIEAKKTFKMSKYCSSSCSSCSCQSSRKVSSSKKSSKQKKEEKQLYVCKCNSSHCRCYKTVKNDSKPKPRQDVYYACHCVGGQCSCFMKRGDGEWKPKAVKQERSTRSYKRDHHYACKCSGKHCKCFKKRGNKDWEPVAPVYRRRSEKHYPTFASDKVLNDLFF